MPFVDGWTCPACWKPNRAKDTVCFHCKTPRVADEAQVEAQRAAIAARAKEPQPEVVPDLVVALPTVIFRTYARVWLRGGIGLAGFVLLLGLAGMPDLDAIVFTAASAAGLVVFGVLAREVSEGMRAREVWAYVIGLLMSIVAVIGSVLVFQAFSPISVHPNAVRWVSVLIFGGAALAALAGLVLLVTRGRTAA
jgi:hypothetical protein